MAAGASHKSGQAPDASHSTGQTGEPTPRHDPRLSVVAVADRPHRRHQPGLPGPLGERPGGELDVPWSEWITVPPRRRRGCSIAMPSALVTSAAVGRGVDRPADHAAGEGVEHDRAVDLALAGGVLGDVGHPQLVRAGRAANLRSTRSSAIWSGLACRHLRPAGAARRCRRGASAARPRCGRPRSRGRARSSAWTRRAP